MILQPTPGVVTPGAVTFEDIVRARERIRGAVAETPCTESPALSELTGAHVFCKLDYLQRTGSFKVRGARNVLLSLLEDLPPDAGDGARAGGGEGVGRGVIAASAGNHALGLSYHGGLLGVPVTVVMPATAPSVKVDSCRRLGANIVLRGDTFFDAQTQALELATRDGLRYVSAFDDPQVIAGQGTMTLEILEQVGDVDYIIIPVGGGGLIAAACLVAQRLRPEVRVIGVESENAASMSLALRRGGPTHFDVLPTIADGLGVPKAGRIAYDILRDRMHRLVTVTEDEIAVAILRLVELEKSVVEGAAASTLAAVLCGRLPELKGRRVVLALCGANIDPSVLCRAVERGLVADGRLCRCTAVISDRAGGLAEFARLVASAGASIREVTHERAFASAGGGFASVEVQCVLETRGHAHVREVHDVLRRSSIPFLYAPAKQRRSVRPRRPQGT